MTTGDLKKGDSFYFIDYPRSIFLLININKNKSGTPKKAKIIPSGRLYPVYTSLKKEVRKVNI
jgi:hypothetical protein